MLRNDDLRTLAYLAFVELGQRLGKKESGTTLEMFNQAKLGGLLDYNVNDDGTIYVFPLASKPATQVASVEGIDSHGGMGERK